MLFNTIIVTLAIALTAAAAPAEALWGDGRMDQLKRSPVPAEALWGDGRMDQLKRTVSDSGHGLPTRFSPLCEGVSSGDRLKRCMYERRNEDELVGRTDSTLAVK